MEWLPIETAPKDGEYLVSSHKGAILIAHYRGGQWFRRSFSMRLSGITHWMPLPSPPTSD